MSRCDDPECVDTNSQCEDITIVNALIAYTLYALQSATVSNVARAIIGHYTQQQITDAKNRLWRQWNIIGEKKWRRDSSVRPDKDANVEVVTSALHKLDKAGMLPSIAIDALSLGGIDLLMTLAIIGKLLLVAFWEKH